MAAKFWVGGTGTWDASTTTHWANSSNGAGGQSVPGSGDTVTFDGSSGGGTVTVNTTVNVTSITMSAFTGTLDFSANNNNVTLVSFANTNASTVTRTLNLGNGTWTLTGTGTVWNQLQVPGLTFNANGSTINFTGTGTSRRTFSLNSGNTFNNITIGANSSGGSFLFNMASGGPQISGTLTISGPCVVEIPQGATATIANIVATGSPTGVPVLKSTSTDTAATVSVSGTASFQWGAVRDITFSGAGSVTTQNTIDLGHNSGITFVPPTNSAQPTLGIGF